MTVFMPPGLVRRAVRVNSTALRFRSPVVYVGRTVRVWISFGTSSALDTELELTLAETPTILNVTPSAFTVGDATGVGFRRPLNVYGENFSPDDYCLFQSTSLPVLRVPLYEFVTSEHVQCQAPSLSPVDAVLPPIEPDPIDYCALQIDIGEQLQAITDRLNEIAIARSQLADGASMPGYIPSPGPPEDPNLTVTMQYERRFVNKSNESYWERRWVDPYPWRQDPNDGPLYPWEREDDERRLEEDFVTVVGDDNLSRNFSNLSSNLSNGTNESNLSFFDLINSLHNASAEAIGSTTTAYQQTLTAEELELLSNRSTLQVNFGVAGIECAAVGPLQVQSQPLGGYLLVSIFSASLDDNIPLNLGYGAASVRLLPSLGISSITPVSGPVTGGTLVAVEGAGFTQVGDLSCAIDDDVLVNARYMSPSLIYCTMPAYRTPGTIEVKVASRGYELSYSAVNFSYYPL
jgi:hypothetical protein